MKADPSAQRALLDVQALDSRLDNLRHQAAHPPEDARLRELSLQKADLTGRRTDLRTALGDLEREQRKAEADVEQVRSRRTRDQQRLDSGAVGTAKDLERLQHEIASLGRRISDLEDVELEVMEQLEAAQAGLVEVEAALAQVQEEGSSLLARRTERVTSLAEEAARVSRERHDVASPLPAPLLALYDRLREQKGGVGAARLRARRCEGCSLQLDNAEVAAIGRTPADEVVRCQECGRVLVRTDESGL